MEITPPMIRALVEAQAVIAELSKDGENRAQGFGYVTSEKIIYHGARALGAHGLYLNRTEVRVGPWETHEVTGAKGTSVYLVATVECTFALMHVEGGGMLMNYACPAVQSAGRPADKAVLATLTELLSYCLRDVLLIARGGDDNIAGRDDTGEAKAGRRGQSDAPRNQPAERPRPTERPEESRGTHPKAAAVQGAPASASPLEGQRIPLPTVTAGGFDDVERDALLRKLRDVAISRGKYGHGPGQVNDAMVATKSTEAIRKTIAALEALPVEDDDAIPY